MKISFVVDKLHKKGLFACRFLKDFVLRHRAANESWSLENYLMIQLIINNYEECFSKDCHQSSRRSNYKVYAK
jgi:hypothetical protein